MIKVDTTILDNFAKKIDRKLKERDQFIKECAQAITLKFYESLMENTPRLSGQLARGWIGLEGKGPKPTMGQVKNYVENMNISKNGDTYTIEVVNNTKYAPYVEYGHRTRGGHGWTQGSFMMTISEKEVELEKEEIIQLKVEKFLKECFK